MTLEEIIAEGVRWLLKSVQPDDSLLQYHGSVAPVVDDIQAGFCPMGHNGGPVVVVDRRPCRYEGLDLANPLTPAEMARVAAAIAATGAVVVDTWNGAKFSTGSFLLAGLSSPSLRAAVGRYHAGCPEHHTVFCGQTGRPPCDWYAAHHGLTVRPSWGA